MTTNRRVVLARRPEGEPVAADFRIEESPVPKPSAEEVLVRTIYLSLDPYMRGRMNAGKSYASPVELNAVMEGGTVGLVTQSNSTKFAAGDVVVGRTGWQDYAAVAADSIRRVDTGGAPMSTALGVLGMPGMTAYTGLLNIGKPQAGETLVVAAASGAVGSVVGQIGKLKGCRVVGIAGGAKKCSYVVDELGFDACIDHRANDFEDQLAAACTDGIDIYFENVAGRVLRAVIPHLNFFSRVPVCGLISQYNASALPDGPDHLPLLMRTILTCRVALRGFIVTDFQEQAKDFRRDVGQWVSEGKIKYLEHRVAGLETPQKRL